MSDEQVPEQDDDFEAAEFALGLGDADTRRAARDRALTDRNFALLIASWQERFVAMTDDIAPVKPHKRVKKALHAQLFPNTRVPFMERLWVWQGLALGAVCLAAYFAMPQLRPAPIESSGSVYATQLSGGTGTLEMLAVFDPEQGDIALRRLSGAAPEGRVLELWAILPEQAPISLGVLATDDANRVPLPDELVPHAGMITLAVTDEPPNGAPGGVATGQVMALGALSEI